jgi:Histidine kinase-, DNA gyrase B-, and HSP90-like ATPase
MFNLAANEPSKIRRSSMASDRLLTELQRQQKYLERLPDDFTFPLFNAKQAIDSQRASAYRNTGAASREIVDNAMEAGADKIHVIFDTQRGNGNRRLIDAVAFIDNGSGMLPKMVRYALSWGGGTHFDDPAFIGKFGFGLPNASINQTTCVEVYSRTSATEPFIKGWLDIRDYKGYQTQVIREPIEAPLPEFVQRYLEKEGWTLDHGTVVVWVRPDRLTYRSPSNLREHKVEDFGIVYRYLLANPERMIELNVDSVTVRPVDLMFLLPEEQYYVSAEEGGAEILKDELLPVRYFINHETGERELELLDPDSVIQLNHEDPNLLAIGTIHARLAHLLVDFAEARSGKGPPTDANRRFEARKTHYGLSFVRNNREIQTLDAFPRSARDKGNGLGSWPLLQGYAYHAA